MLGTRSGTGYVRSLSTYATSFDGGPAYGVNTSRSISACRPHPRLLVIR